MEWKFFGAARDGDTALFMSLLRDHPDLDINWAMSNSFASTALHLAADYGQDSIVRILLAHPDINVNPLDNHGATPLFWACRYGNTEVVRLLLQDGRVQAHQANPRTRSTPLREAAANGHADVIRLMIASGRDVVGATRGREGDPLTDPVASAQANGWLPALLLLRAFWDNRSLAIAKAREDLGLEGSLPLFPLFPSFPFFSCSFHVHLHDLGPRSFSLSLFQSRSHRPIFFFSSSFVLLQISRCRSPQPSPESSTRPTSRAPPFPS